MAQHKVIDLINQFMEDHGQSSGKDRVLLWFEDVYSKIRLLPWSWNFTLTETQTGGGLYSTPALTSDAAVETFSWTQGDDFIVSTAATVAIVTADHTGRYVYLSEEWYQCKRVAPTGNTNKIYLHKKIVAASASTQTISFYRRDLAVTTNGIKSVHVDNQKIEPLKDEQIYRFKRGLDPRWYYGDSGSPLAYHLDEYTVQAPQYAPSVAAAASATATTTPGTHVAFWTFYDKETGQESAPGPTVEFSVTAALPQISLGYSSTSLHSADETTFSRRLYVTKKIESYTRNASFLLTTLASASTSVFPLAISDTLLQGLGKYYDGAWARMVLYPAPDSYERAEVYHIDTWIGFPEEQDIVTLGRQREFIELFHLYFLMKQSLQNKDPKQFRMMQASFREQLNFLQAQDGDDRRLDPSSWEYKFFSPSSAILSDEEFTASLKYPF